MVVKKNLLLFIALFLITFLLTACPQPPVVEPTAMSFNGVTKIDSTKGQANLSVSALKDETVLSSADISRASATVDSVITSNLAPRQTFAANASVCGDIEGKEFTAITAVLTLDSTGSMATNDPQKLRSTAAKDFVTRLTTGDKTAVTSFDTGTSPTTPYNAIKLWQAFTDDKVLLEQGIDNATFNGSGTNVWDAGVDSVNLLSKTTGENKLLVLLTDGEDNSSSRAARDVIDTANTNNVDVYTIGLGKSLNFSQLTDIASLTGGTFNQVDEAGDLIGLYDGIFNATQAAGCIQLTFSPVPTSGTKLSGKLSATINGVSLTEDYAVRFP